MRTIFALVIFIASTSISSAYHPDQCARNEAYIQKFKKIAVIEMHKSGIPASIKLAQGILESAAGTSELARKANNHFGIKCGGSWNGPSFYRKDDDYNKFGKKIKSCFRAYKNPEASFTAHTEFLTNPAKSSRYGFLFNYKKTDYKKWARGLKKAGYATNPKYPTLLIKVIEDNNLHQFDYLSVQDVLEGEDEGAVLTDDYQGESLPEVRPGKKMEEEINAPSKPDYKKYNNSKFKSSKKETGENNSIFLVNDIKVVKIQNGDTPAKVAKRHNLSRSKVLKYNDLSGLEPLEVGGNIFLQPKRGSFRGKKNFHVVEKEESMYKISQKYGIKLAKLYKRNNMKPGQEPLDGEHVNLRGKRYKMPRLKNETGNKPSKSSSDKTKPSKSPATFPSKRKNDKKVMKYEIHTVQRGETLYRIAKQHGVTVDDVKKWNKLKVNTIEIGQELKIYKP